MQLCLGNDNFSVINSSLPSVRKPWVKGRRTIPPALLLALYFFQAQLQTLTVQCPHRSSEVLQAASPFYSWENRRTKVRDLPRGALTQWSIPAPQLPTPSTAQEKMLVAASFQKGYITSSINIMVFCEHCFWKHSSLQQFCYISFFINFFLFFYNDSYLFLPWFLSSSPSFPHSLYLLQESLQLPMKSILNTCWNRYFTSYLLMFTYCPMFYVLPFAWEIAYTHSIPLLLKGGKSWPGPQSNSAAVANIRRKSLRLTFPTSWFINKKTNPTFPSCIVSKQCQSRLSNAQELCIPEVFITSVFQGGILSFE